MDAIKEEILKKIDQITEQLNLIKDYENHWPSKNESAMKTKEILQQELQQLKTLTENKPL